MSEKLSIEIRRYIPANKENVIELFRLNTPVYFAPAEEEDLLHYLEYDADNYFVAIHNDKLCGCGGFNQLNDPPIVRISWDIIHPEMQGKGVGTKLTAFRLKEIKKLESIQTVAVRTSQLAFKFYQRFGFIVKETVKDYWAPGFDLYNMECSIDQIETPQ